MSEGTKVTMAEVFRRKSEELRRQAEESAAWRQTPEGQAWEAQQQRLMEADLRYAEEHPETQTPDDELETEEEEGDVEDDTEGAG